MTTSRMLDIIKGFLICFVGGGTCSLIRVPLPWMIGPLFAMAFTRIRSSNARPPRGGRQAGQLIIGCALGQYFSPDVGHAVMANAWLILGASCAVLCLAFLSSTVLSRLAGLDMTTAFFSSLPGGASEMVVLADRFGAKVDRVALAQSIRVLMVVVIVPFVIFWSGASGTDLYQPIARVFSAGGLAVLVLVAALCGLGLWRLRIPNAWMFGPLFVSMGLALLECRTSAVPSFLTNCAQLLIGWNLGSRFMPGFLREVPRFVRGVIVSVMVSLVLAAALGGFLSLAGAIPVASAVLATAPGGIAEMCITAKVLHLGVPLVTSFHVMRLVVIMTLSAPAARLARISAS